MTRPASQTDLAHGLSAARGGLTQRLRPEGFGEGIPLPGYRALRAVALMALLVVAGCGGGAAASTPFAHDAGAPVAKPPTLAQPGDMAPDYITDVNYGSLLVEVDYVEGFAPSDALLQRVRDALFGRISKPLGVAVVRDTEIPYASVGNRTRWQTGDILALEEKFRGNHTGDAANPDQAVIWIVYLPGQAEADEEGERALGVAYSYSSIVLFPESIRCTTPFEALEVVEALTLVHESGHLFGLVNNGIPMARGHEDLDNPRHDRNPDCVMRHRIEKGFAAKLLERPPLDFCYACRLDLYLAGGPLPGADEMAVLPPPVYDESVVLPISPGPDASFKATTPSK